MIKDIDITVYEMLTKLHEIKNTTFHLTGSRFFKTNHSLSDWDFFAQYTPNAEDELINLGFKDITKAERAYGDTEAVKIYRYNAGRFSSQVDVQLVRSWQIKYTAQMLIVFNNEMMTRSTAIRGATIKRRATWERAYSFARNIEQEVYR